MIDIHLEIVLDVWEDVQWLEKSMSEILVEEDFVSFSLLMDVFSMNLENLNEKIDRYDQRLLIMNELNLILEEREMEGLRRDKQTR